MSSNVRDLIEIAVEYRAEHLGKNMAVTSVDTTRTTLWGRYKTQLFLEAWRRYANLILDRVKYVGTGRSGNIMAQITQERDPYQHAGGTGSHPHGSYHVIHTRMCRHIHRFLIQPPSH